MSGFLQAYIFKMKVILSMFPKPQGRTHAWFLVIFLISGFVGIKISLLIFFKTIKTKLFSYMIKESP